MGRMVANMMLISPLQDSQPMRTEFARAANGRRPNSSPGALLSAAVVLFRPVAALAGDPSDERVIEPLARDAVTGLLGFSGQTTVPLSAIRCSLSAIPRRLGAAPHLRTQVV